ncbi:hypothetical protein RHAB21_00734 [Pseudorhizobium halotolerans]|uniref:Uncharacterized protein n=1 Tax=Pseudorhizobium halotolerans TaxID=1233081 RepID=A0ABN7JZR5_9HYPH|nr:hypothetical protein RHAB21_00734 [Pseudorhizobium halotolerans]
MRRKPLPDDEPRDPHLADFTGRKIVVQCATCGMRRRYDASAMLKKVPDMSLPELRLKLAEAEGCLKVHNPYYDRCGLRYDVEAMGLL